MKIGLCVSKKITAGLMSDNLYLFNMTFGRGSLIMLTKSIYLCIHSTSKVYFCHYHNIYITFRNQFPCFN